VDRDDVLAQFAFFTKLPAAARQSLADASQFVRLRQDAYFYREGDEVAQFALVGSGSIRVYKTAETGREVNLYHVRAGETCLVNLISVLLERKALASARASSETEAVILPASHCRGLVGQNEVVRTFVFESMAMRLVDMMTLTEDVVFRNLDTRLAEFLCGRFETQGAPVREIAITHEEIAAEMGTAREVVSRLLKEFERSGALGLGRGRIELLSASGLQALRRRQPS
jgi:CRP/FNR family transcriptional regulator